MDKIKYIIYSNNTIVNINNIINILDNLTNTERNIVFNKLYHVNNYNDIDDNNIYDHTFLQKIYLNYSNKFDILFILLNKYKDNININVKNSRGKTLLYFITFNGDIDILKYMYEFYGDVNISINILDNNSENILFNIIKYTKYNENIVKLLLEKNTKIQYKLLKYLIDLYNNKKYNEGYDEEYNDGIMNILLKYLHKNDNNQYDYVLEELYKYVIENYKINEDNKDFYDKIFPIKSNTKSAAKIINN